ncbi:MAG: heme-binding domain-containing protein [SAR324 cluster bacterium]|nr:heme-binding domain-containing protein [SAR324 cluster bacterium]
MAVKKTLKIFLIGLIILWVISLIVARLLLPVANPDKRNALPDWLSDNSKASIKRSCFDCHSNEVVYPWYSYMPVVSMLVAVDVKKGRKNLNFSLWDENDFQGIRRDFDDVLEVINEDTMPLSIYTILHPDTIFSRSEYISLINDYEGYLKLNQTK